MAKVGRPRKVSANRNPAGKEGVPVSLYPLSFDEAISGLAQTKMPEPESKKPPTKPAKGK
jgi:hypothetical protein